MYYQPNVAYRIPDDSSPLEAVYEYPNVKEATPMIEKKLKKRINCSLAVAAVAIVLAIVAILFAVVYTTVVWKVTHDDELLQRDNSGQLNVSEQKIYLLQTQLSDSEKSLQAQLNDQAQEIRSLQTEVLENQPAIYFAESCKEIPEDSPSGFYNIQRGSVKVYCDMNRTSCSCNSTRGWTRVANLDMRNPNQTCPSELRVLSRNNLRLCGRQEQVRAGCSSTTFSTYGFEYSHICGRIIGYQKESPDGFHPYNRNNALTINDNYVDGISLTHGQPGSREHIWTFAGALDELTSFGPGRGCPCINSIIDPGTAPPFVGQDYFCDTGSREPFENILYADDPLWDGAGCEGANTCCEFKTPPWFCKQLPQPTTDDIELRICGDQSATTDEDTPFELVEIYIR